MQAIFKPYKFLAILLCVLWTSWCVFNINDRVPSSSYHSSTVESETSPSTDYLVRPSFQMPTVESVTYRPSTTPTPGVQTEQLPSIWNRIGDEFQLNHQENSPAVQKEIRKLLADQKRLNSILQAAGPYIYFIHKQIEMRGLPSEITLIPFIESEYNPNDHSSKGATGLWQLMPQTATGLGVKIKSQYDGRRNVVSSTQAALNYFKDLGHLFKGDWYLAIAAYNCGEGKVKSAQRRSGEQSFWNLHLPQETKVYVPKLLAIAAIIKNPARYGVELPHVADHPFFSMLKLKNAMTLEELAKQTHIDLAILKKLNPDFAHGNHQGVEVILPLAKIDEAKALLVDNIQMS